MQIHETIITMMKMRHHVIRCLNVRTITLFAVLLLTFPQLIRAADAAGKNSSYAVFAGGVAGVADLTVAGNSSAFRAAGGGLYLHNNGWNSLTGAQRRQVLAIFSNAPTAIELGFGGNDRSAKAWAGACRRSYLAPGIRPEFIAAM